ncbi:MAG: proline dehydrogenase family protein [Actinomycetota bacterium]|nr:proline dehydrogenase family protein [Actinomycetota bacterium]
MEKLVTRSRLTRSVVDRFVAGYALDDAIDAIVDLNGKKVGGILDLLGEGVSDPEGAAAAADDYLVAIKRIQESGVDTTVSVKLTQLGLAFDKGACIDHLRRLAAEATAAGTTVEIDMEQSDYVSDTLDVYRLLHADHPELRIAIQAYLRRTPIDLEMMAGIKPKVRLVKGAYAEPENVAFRKRTEIDAQFAFLTDWLFRRGTMPAIASHDGELLDHATSAAAHNNVGKDDFEIQMLYGVRSDLQESLAAQGYKVRCYVPYGSAWYPYLTRRIAERPANLRFFLRALIRR